MARKLPNYLRSYRRCACLSQGEVALLLGCDPSEVAHYERSSRRPQLESTLAYELIFGAPVQDLFAGVRDKVEEATRKRAQLLLKKLSAKTPDPMTARKLELLRKIATAREPELAPSV